MNTQAIEIGPAANHLKENKEEVHEFELKVLNRFIASNIE